MTYPEPDQDDPLFDNIRALIPYIALIAAIGTAIGILMLLASIIQL